MAKRHAGDQTFPGFIDVVEIGRGGSSVVYRALEEAAGRRAVALKVLTVSEATPHAVKFFTDETQALGMVSSHPNIVTLYRAEALADGRRMLVLELCNGSIMSEIRAGSPMPARRAISVAVKIAGALETAHGAGVLHRDVKPQNILLTSFNEPALADFGVARLQASRQPTVGVFGFTTLHAPPEILEGKEASAATDVYELASTLYQLVVGRAAFRNFGDENPAAMVYRILTEPVAPIYGDNIPGGLSQVLTQSMAKDASERPQSARAFANALNWIERAQGWDPTPFHVLHPDGRGETVTLGPAASTSSPAPVVRPRPHAESAPPGRTVIVGPRGGPTDAEAKPSDGGLPEAPRPPVVPVRERDHGTSAHTVKIAGTDLPSPEAIARARAGRAGASTTADAAPAAVSSTRSTVTIAAAVLLVVLVSLMTIGQLAG